jgi:hypothetical protein
MIHAGSQHKPQELMQEHSQQQASVGQRQRILAHDGLFEMF